MGDFYKERICTVCGGVVDCGVASTEEDDIGYFSLVFTAKCRGCGLDVTGNKSTVFKLFNEKKNASASLQAIMNKVTASNINIDDKWVYVTGSYRGI